MNKEYKVMKGNEAMAEAALRAGCRFYAGYPITPQSEILQYMAAHMEKDYGGVFIQGENEIASMSMLWGAAACGVRSMSSSSGPGYDLKQEGISYLASYNLPAVIADVMRYGTGDGEITAGQDSYWMATKAGGHGDSRQVVLAPASVQESADLTYEAFDIAEKYRTQVILLSDGSIGQMIEKVYLPEPREHDKDQFDWAIKSRKAKDEPKVKVTYDGAVRGYKNFEGQNPPGDFYDEYNRKNRRRFKDIHEQEQRWEEFMLEDAELVFVAIGISSRVCKSAVRRARENGVKLGLLRPISVVPFPQKAFDKLPDTVKGFVTVEMSLCSQLGQDVMLAARCRKPVYSYCTTKYIPTVQGCVDFVNDVLAGKVEELEVL